MLHRTRRLALQGLCCVDAQGSGAWKMIDHFIADSNENLDVVHASRKLLRSCHEAVQKCDSLLQKHARRWELGRLALVDRNILRLATFELLQNEVPFKVVISESLKLAREFSTAESPRFVNGVLDAIARDLRKQRGEEDLPVPQGKVYPKPRTEEEIIKVEKPVRAPLLGAKEDEDQEPRLSREEIYARERARVSKGVKEPEKPAFDARKFGADLEARADEFATETVELTNFTSHGTSSEKSASELDNNAKASEIFVSISKQQDKIEADLSADEKEADQEIDRTSDDFINGKMSLLDSVIGSGLKNASTPDPEDDDDDDFDDYDDYDF